MKKFVSSARCLLFLVLTVLASIGPSAPLTTVSADSSSPGQILFTDTTAYEPMGGMSRFDANIGVASETGAYARLEGTDLPRLAEFMPAASSSGKIIAYVTLPLETIDHYGQRPSIDLNEAEIYTFNMGPSTREKVTNNSWIDVCPNVAPDGSKIVWSRSEDGGRTYSLIIEELGTGRGSSFTSGYIDIEPYFSPDGQKVVFSSNRGGDGKFRIYTLDVTRVGLQPQQLEIYEHVGSELVYDFLGHAREASWISGAVVEGTLPFPGNEADSAGFARYVDNAVLEDGSTWQRVLETHPQWISNGFTAGVYPSQTVPQNVQLKVRIGFLQGATGTDGVTFEVRFMDESQNMYTVLSHETTYDNKLDLITEDLSFLAGKRGKFILYVNAGESSAQDWAAWAEAEIETVPVMENVDYEGISPSWSPDGSLIAFSKRNADTGHFRICIASPTTGESRIVTWYPPPGFTDEMRPRWSPDGTRLVYEGRYELILDHGGFRYSLYMVDVASGRFVLFLDNLREAPHPVSCPPGFPSYYGEGSSPCPYWTPSYAGRMTIVADDPLDSAIANQEYEYYFDIIGGSPPYDVMVLDRPAGIFPSYDMDEGGWLRGTPTEAGVYNVSFRVTDSGGTLAIKTCKLPVYSESMHLGMDWPWPGDEYYIITTVGKPFEFDVSTTLYGGVPPYNISYDVYPEWAEIVDGKVVGTPSGGAYKVFFTVIDAVGNRYTYRSFDIFVLYPSYAHYVELSGTQSLGMSPPYPEEWVGYISETELLPRETLDASLYVSSPLAYVRGIAGFDYAWLQDGRYSELSIQNMCLEVTRDAETLEFRDTPGIERWGNAGIKLTGYSQVPRSSIFPSSEPLQKVASRYELTIGTRGGQTATLNDTVYIYRSAYRAMHGWVFDNFPTPYLDPRLARSYFGDDDFCAEEQLPWWTGASELIELFTDCCPDPIALLFLDQIYTGAAKANCYGMCLLSLRAREGNLRYYLRPRTDYEWSSERRKAFTIPFYGNDTRPFQFRDWSLNHFGTSYGPNWRERGGSAWGDIKTCINTLQGANLDMDHLTHGIDKVILGGRYDPLAPAMGHAAYEKPDWLVSLWTKNLYEDVKENLREKGEHRDFEGYPDSELYSPLIILMLNSFADAHAVVAYDMVENDDEAYIFVYDPNHPFNPADPDEGEFSYILIDKREDGGWKWSFNFGKDDVGNLVVWSGGYIWAEPYPLVGHEMSPNFPSSDDIPEFLSRIPQGGGVLIAFLEDLVAGSAEVEQITDESGATFYTEDGRINVDPRTAVIGMVWSPPGAGPDSKLYALVRNSTYNFKVGGLKEGEYAFTCTQGNLFLLADTSSTSGSSDSFLLDPLGSSMGFVPLSDSKPITLYIDRFFGKEELREIAIKDFKTFLDKGFSITTDDENDFIIIRNLGPDTTFNIGFRHTSKEGISEAEYQNIEIKEGETLKATPNWTDSLKEATADVDVNSDGTWDNTTALENLARPGIHMPLWIIVLLVIIIIAVPVTIRVLRRGRQA